VIILNRAPREAHRRGPRTGARIKLIGDGDVSAAIATCFPETGVDVLMGIGALRRRDRRGGIRCMGGDMQGRLAPRNDKEIERAQKMGIKDVKKVFEVEEMAQGNVIFAATGVTSGDFLRGVRFFKVRGDPLGGDALEEPYHSLHPVRHTFEHKPNFA